MKHGNSFYLELTRELFTEEYKTLSNGAKWLFVVLNELEQRYTGKGCDYFFRTNEELAKDAGVRAYYKCDWYSNYQNNRVRSNFVEM